MQVKLSVIMLTYNHEKYIAEAIEGVLLQKTNFGFELIVANDHSADGTEAIVEDYRSRYPTIVKGYYNKKNIGPRFNFIKAYGKAGGEFIAMCEGDDYWTDPNKLQKQVDFLTSNPDYVLSFHDIKMIDDAGNPVDDNRIPAERKRDYQKNELFGYYLPTPTLVYRNVFTKLPSAFKKSDNGDTILQAFLTQWGKTKYMEEIESAFVRLHPGGLWSTRKMPEKWKSILKTRILIYQSLNKTLRKQVFDLYVNVFEIASGAAEEFDTKRHFWYIYNFSYMKFCLLSGSYGKLLLITRRVVNKFFFK